MFIESEYAHDYSKDEYKTFTSAIDDVADELELKVANWGKLVYDMMTGEAVVENGAYEYNKNTFIVSKSAGDGYHPNLLTGYITTQMIYSLLTGETAVGEECAFCTDARISEWYDLEFILGYYYSYDNISDAESEIKLTGDDLTNFPEILASKTEMAGIQNLIDNYIKSNK